MPFCIPIRQQYNRRPQFRSVRRPVSISVEIPVRRPTRSSRHVCGAAISMCAVPSARNDSRRSFRPRRKKLRMHPIVLRPRRLDRTRKRQHSVRIERVIQRRRDREPIPAMLDRPPRILPHKPSRISRVRIPANMLQPPVKRHHAPIVIGRPPPVLILPYPPLKPMHSQNSQTSSRNSQPHSFSQ